MQTFSGSLPVPYFISSPFLLTLIWLLTLVYRKIKIVTADSYRGWPEIEQCNIPSWRTFFDVIIIEGNKTAKGWTSMFVWNCSGTWENPRNLLSTRFGNKNHLMWSHDHPINDILWYNSTSQYFIGPVRGQSLVFSGSKIPFSGLNSCVGFWIDFSICQNCS